MLDDPRVMAAQLPLVPPLIELGRKLDWQPLPLTIKEGRAFARRLAEPTGGDTGTRRQGDMGETANTADPPRRQDARVVPS